MFSPLEHFAKTAVKNISKSILMDNLEKQGAADRSRINFSQDHEITYWTSKFNVSVPQLYSAAQEAGSSVSKIEGVLLRMGYLTQTETKP